MGWLKRHWGTLCALFLSGLYVYLQLLQWKKHGDDLMLTAANIVVTCVLWAVLLIAIARYWRLGSDRRKGRESNDTVAEATKPDTRLRAKTIATCDELTDFLREHGPKPEIPHERGEADADYLFKAMAVLDPYKRKMGADFRLRCSGSVKRIRDEIQAGGIFSERPLDKAIELAESDFCEPKFVEEIRRHFWKMAEKMEK